MNVSWDSHHKATWSSCQITKFKTYLSFLKFYCKQIFLLKSSRNFENNVSKTSSIHSGEKWGRKMDIHIIGSKTNSSFLPNSQIYLYYFLHLWPFNRNVPFGDALEWDSLPIISWISKTFLQWKGCHLKKQRDCGASLVISGILGISFFLFLNLNWYITTKFCLQ